MEPLAGGTREFKSRARHECERYGHDAWVFVRELLQNARDAGATRVLFTSTLEADGGFAVTCRDDGCGMSFEHARRYLFRLYASSKDGRRGSAGRFGVGFWSLLAFEPLAIVVQSWPTSGAPWELELDGELLAAQRRRPPASGRGTCVRVQRRLAPADARERLAEAVGRYGRFLTRLDAPRRALDVRVDGRSVAEPFDLPAPRARFERRGLRGVVGLGTEPRVELLVKGLPVRNAACLQDLLAVEARPDRAARSELGTGLGPVVLLDSHDVEVQITRDEPRASAALERLVAAAEDELDLLIEGQLDCLRPEPALRRAWRRLVRRPAAPWCAAAAAAALVALLGASLPREPSAATVASLAPPTAPTPQAAAATAGAAAPRRAAYRDLGLSYAGPWSNLASDALGPPLALRYSPAGERPSFVALVADPLEAAPGEARDGGAYAGPACERGCLSVELRALTADGGWLRLPVPSGHRLDPASVSVDGAPVELRVSERDEPLVALPAGTAVRVGYRSGPGPARVPAPPQPERLPAQLAAAASRLATLHERERPGAARDWVTARVRYSIAPETAALHRRLRARPFPERALEAGAGDCDVQNGVLALLLQAAGTPARLSIGYLGRDGQALPWLHGWAEYVGPDGAWHALDASVPQAQPEVASMAPTDPAQIHGATPVFTDAPLPVPARALKPPAVTPAAPGRASPNARALAALLGLALIAVTAGLWRARRTRRELKLDRGAQLVELVRGVLQNPQAFDHLPSLLRRPLLSRLGRGPLELGRAWSLAAAARLYASRRHTPLARQAAGRGLSVLDVNHEEARLAAEALGAIDLDEWQERLERAHAGPLQSANAHLRALGEDWRAAVVTGLGAARLLRLPGVRLEPDERAERLLLVDGGEDWLRPCGRGEARLRYESLARLSELAGLSADERLRLLELPAREALREALS